MKIDKPECSTENMTPAGDNQFISAAQLALLDSFEYGDYVPTQSPGFASDNPISLDYAKYVRLGDIVFVYISFSIEASDNGLFFTYLSIPIESAFTDSFQASGRMRSTSTPTPPADEDVTVSNTLSNQVGIAITSADAINGQVYKFAGFFTYPVLV